MKTIANDIKDGRIKKAYLLFGEEAYLKIQYKNRLLKAMNPDDDTMNFAMFEGKNIDPKEIISLADTMPFFADYRTILIQNSGFFKNANDEMCDYFKGSPSETTRFLFVESEVDKRNRFYKIIKEYGSAVEFQLQDEEYLKAFVGKFLQNNNFKITLNDALYLIDRTGNDLGNMKLELEKLVNYAYGRDVITRADIDAIVTRRAANHIFEMMDAIALKQQKKALDMYYDLIALKESPIGILVLLTRHFNKLLQTKDLRSRGYSNGDIAKKVAIVPYYIGKYIDQASRFKEETLIAALTDCADTEDKVKKGLIDDELAIEMLICKYSA